MPDPISHAEMIAALQAMIDRNADRASRQPLFDTDIFWLRAVLAHLERTQWRSIEGAPGLAQKSYAWTWFLAQRSAFEDEFEVVRVSDRNSDFPFVTPSGHRYAEDSFIKWMPLPPSPETPR